MAFQWLGHAMALPATGGALPPSCGSGVSPGASLLWVDPSLVPGTPRALLTELRFAEFAPDAAVEGGATSSSARGLGWRLVRLRRQRTSSVLTVEDLHELHRALPRIGSRAGRRGNGATLLEGTSTGVVQGQIDVTLDVDAGDILGLLGTCGSSAPVAAVAGTTSSPAAVGDTGPTVASDERLPSLTAAAFALVLQMAVQPGLEVHVGDAWAAPWPAWAFAYEPLWPPTPPPSSERLERGALSWPAALRSGGAVQVLARVREDAKCKDLEHPLVENLRIFSYHCSWARRYPVFVLHTAHLEDAGVEELLSWADTIRRAAHPELVLRFFDVSFDFERVRLGDSKVRLEDLDLLWMDLTRPRSRQYREAKPRRFKTGYRHMCRFHSSTVLSLPVFARFRYLMHMDSDATLRCHPGTEGPDPIEELARADMVYGLFEVGVEDPEYVEGWTGFLEEYMLLHEIEPQVPMEFLSSRGALYTKENPQNPGELINASTDELAVTWGTGWEILDLQFFASDRVLEFSNKIERSLGHYRHNWGDHLVRAYQVQLFAPLSRVRCFDSEELPGMHGCGNIGQEAGSEFLYHFMDGLLCPDQWTNIGLTGVPWLESDSSPRPCLELCNEVNCEGFDLVFYAETSTADCYIRRVRASPDVCIGGGPEGDAGASLRSFGAVHGTISILGATNRYQVVERNLNRSFSCTEWRSQLRAKLEENISLPDWPV